jgi:K+-sensing histidine kinase KdpD
MLALVSYLVEIARLNNGHTKLLYVNCDISDLISEATNRWKIQNPSKPLNVELNITDPAFHLDKERIRLIITYLLALASIRVTEGTVSLFVNDSEDALNVRVQSNGKKAVDKSEMDTAMIVFVTTSLVKLHRGRISDPQETEDGLLLSFSLPR